MSKQYTLADFCKDRGITPEWLASKDGNLIIDSQTKRLPDDELIVGGDLTITNPAFPKFPTRVVVGGDLTIAHCDLEDLPNRTEVYGWVRVDHCRFKRIHEGCTFHHSIWFEHCQLREIADYMHVHGNLKLDHCIIDTLPKGLVVDERLSICYTNIQAIPADCRCNELVASYSKLISIPCNWEVSRLDIEGCPITELPKGLRIGSHLNIAYTRISEITEAYPNIALNASYSQVVKLPDNWQARSVFVKGCPIDVLPKGMKVICNLNIAETAITFIPDDCQVGNSIYASKSNLKYVPNHVVLSGYLDVRGSHVKVIPSSVIARWIDCDADVQVNAYRFNAQRRRIDIHPNGQYVWCDGILSKILEHKGNVWRCADMYFENEHFVVTDGEGRYAHGTTIHEAETELRPKFGHQVLTRYQHLKLDDSLSFKDAYTCYREITGACRFGTDQFIQSLPEVKESYTIREIIELTKGQYGHLVFAQFFRAA